MCGRARAPSRYISAEQATWGPQRLPPGPAWGRGLREYLVENVTSHAPKMAPCVRKSRRILLARSLYGAGKARMHMGGRGNRLAPSEKLQGSIGRQRAASWWLLRREGPAAPGLRAWARGGVAGLHPPMASFRASAIRVEGGTRGRSPCLVNGGIGLGGPA